MAVGTASCCKAKNRHMWRHRLRRPACFKCPKCPKSISMPDVPNLAFGTWCSNVDVPKALSGFMQSAQLSRIQLWDVVTRWQNPESGFRDISMLSKVPKVTFGIPFGTSLHLGVTPILVVAAIVIENLSFRIEAPKRHRFERSLRQSIYYAITRLYKALLRIRRCHTCLYGRKTGLAVQRLGRAAAELSRGALRHGRTQTPLAKQARTK